jgi:hypothetical protein
MIKHYTNIFLSLPKYTFISMLLWILLLIAVIVLIFYLRREHLDSSKDSKDSAGGKDSKDSKDSKDTKSSKDSKDGKDSADASAKESKDSKESKDTTIIIVDSGRNDARRTDPFYTMTDPYWASYNYRWGYGPRYGGHPPIGHRRIW